MSPPRPLTGVGQPLKCPGQPLRNLGLPLRGLSQCLRGLGQLLRGLGGGCADIRTYRFPLYSTGLCPLQQHAMWFRTSWNQAVSIGPLGPPFIFLLTSLTPFAAAIPLVKRYFLQIQQCTDTQECRYINHHKNSSLFVSVILVFWHFYHYYYLSEDKRKLRSNVRMLWYPLFLFLYLIHLQWGTASSEINGIPLGAR